MDEGRDERSGESTYGDDEWDKDPLKVGEGKQDPPPERRVVSRLTPATYNASVAYPTGNTRRTEREKLDSPSSYTPSRARPVHQPVQHSLPEREQHRRVSHEDRDWVLLPPEEEVGNIERVLDEVQQRLSSGESISARERFGTVDQVDGLVQRVGTPDPLKVSPTHASRSKQTESCDTRWGRESWELAAGRGGRTGIPEDDESRDGEPGRDEPVRAVGRRDCRLGSGGTSRDGHLGQRVRVSTLRRVD